MRVASAPWIQNERNNRNNHQEGRRREETRARAAHVHNPTPNNGNQAQNQAQNPPQSQPLPITSRRVPQRLINIPTTTTAAPTTPKEVVEYEYVDYEIPPQAGDRAPNPPHPPSAPISAPNSAPNSRNRRSLRRKGTLPSIPADFLASSPSEFAPVPTSFSCADKISGLAYADIDNDCRMFHLCLPTPTKGKLQDHRMFCKDGQAYQQEKGVCAPQGGFDCAASSKFFVLNKLASEDGRRKWPAAWQKKHLVKRPARD